MHFLRLLAVWWPGTQSARNNYLLACKFAKYSPIFFTDRLSNKPFLIFYWQPHHTLNMLLNSTLPLIYR